MRSLQGKGAGAWLDVVPSSRALAFEPNDFRLACRMRLGVPVPVPHWIRSRNCGDSLDDSGYHLITSKTGGGPVWTHDSVVSTWSDCLRSIDIHHKKSHGKDIETLMTGLELQCSKVVLLAIVTLTLP